MSQKQLNLITLRGIVLRERFSGESDKFIDVLTEKYGIIEICVKGARKLTGKNLAPAMLYAYSCFCLRKRGNMYYIDSAEPIRNFYGITSDIDAFALASYISEVVSYSVPSEQNGTDVMRLVLNTFHFLAEKSRNVDLLKAIFELRFMCESGFMPDVLACHECAAYEPEFMYFIIDEGIMYCDECYIPQENRTAFKINRTVLCAVRHIALMDFEKLFSFNMKNESLERLCRLSEAYLTQHLDKHFKTLDFYKSLRRQGAASNS